MRPATLTRALADGDRVALGVRLTHAGHEGSFGQDRLHHLIDNYLHPAPLARPESD